MKRTALIMVATELNKLLGLDPPLDIKQKDSSALEKETIDGALCFEKEDAPSEELIDALVPVFEDGKVEMTDEQVEVFIHLGILPPAEEEAQNDPPPEDDELRTEVEDAERLKDLKEIAKANDEFKGIRGKLSKYNATKDLRAALLEILDEAEPKEETEEKPSRKPSRTSDKKEGKKPAAKKEKEPVDNYSRVDSVCDVLKKEKTTPTMDDLVEKANDLYNDRKGKDNIKESRTVANFVVKTLAHFDIEVPSE